MQSITEELSSWAVEDSYLPQSHSLADHFSYTKTGRLRPGFRWNHVVIKAIIAGGHSQGMKKAAEGIETENQCSLLKAV